MFAQVESELHALFIAVIALIAVLNPFGNLTQFMAMTEELAMPMRKRLFRNIVFVSFCIVLIFLLSGSFIMEYFFGVSLDDVRVAGGLILIVMSMKNLLFPPSDEAYSHYKNLSFDDLLERSIIPMAFPMLVGPGTLATVIVISEDKSMLLAIGAVILSFIFLFALFHYAATIEKVFGKLTLYIFSRIALVFIMAVGFKTIVVGLRGMNIITP